MQQMCESRIPVEAGLNSEPPKTRKVKTSEPVAKRKFEKFHDSNGLAEVYRKLRSGGQSRPASLNVSQPGVSALPGRPKVSAEPVQKFLQKSSTLAASPSVLQVQGSRCNSNMPIDSRCSPPAAVGTGR